MTTPARRRSTIGPRERAPGHASRGRRSETEITVTLGLDGSGHAAIDTGIGFYDHLLGSFAHHGLFDLAIHADGDLQVDEHHTVEDVALVLGRRRSPRRSAIAPASARFGDSSVPMDESIATRRHRRRRPAVRGHRPAIPRRARRRRCRSSSSSTPSSPSPGPPAHAPPARHRPQRPPPRRGRVQGARPGAARRVRAGSAARAASPRPRARSDERAAARRGSRSSTTAPATSSASTRRSTTVGADGHGRPRRRGAARRRRAGRARASARPAPAMARLDAPRPDRADPRLARRRTGPFLGICLGLQLLFEAQRRGRRDDARRRSPAGRSGSRTRRRSRTSAGTRSSDGATTRCSTASPTAPTSTSSTRTPAPRPSGRRRDVVARHDRRTAARSSRRSRAARCSASSSTPSAAAPTACACSPTSSTLRRGRRLMLRRRVIPCLDVADGRVVKGTRFVDLVDEGDPPELAERYASRGRRRARLPRHHGRARAPRHAPRDRRADGPPGVHPADRRRRRPDASTRCATCCGPAPTRSRSTRRPSRTRRSSAAAPPGSGGRRSSSRSMRAGGRPRRRAWEVVVQGGRERDRPRRVAWAERAVDLGAGELLVTSIDRDGTGSGFDTELLRAITDAGRRAGHRVRRRRRPGRLRRGDRRWRRRRRPRRLDLPSPDPLHRRRQGRDGRRRAARPARPGGRGMSGIASSAPAVAVRPRRPRPGVVQDVARRPRPHARLHGRGGARGHARDRRGPLPLALARPTLAQGRDERQRAAPRRPRGRLRRRRAAGHRRPGRARPAIEARGAASTPTGAPAERPTAGVRLARDAVGDDRVTRRRPTGRLLHGVAARGRRRRRRPQGHRGGDRGPDRGQGRRGRRAHPRRRRAALAGEAADLLYHALVLLAERGLPPSAVIEALRARHA